MCNIARYWKNLSIPKKLYAVVGIMAVLIAGELIVLRFAMSTLSAVRALVMSEGLWSKAQKNAAFHLQRYGLTRDEKDYQVFQDHLRIPEGYHKARIELEKPKPDLLKIHEGFREGHVHPDDIEPMTNLLLRFSDISYLSNAVAIWRAGDRLLNDFRDAGDEYHLLVSRQSNSSRISEVLGKIRSINDELTRLEETFSATLGKGARWMEHVVVSLLFMAVLMVESIGITLTFLTSRTISRGLAEVNAAAIRIGQGDFGRTLTIRSRDEIGVLAQSVNQMSLMLEKQRASELSKANEALRRSETQLKRAVSARDEFLSIASHELKTPITSLKLQLQVARRRFKPEKNIAEMLDASSRQVDRLTHLVENLLDVSMIQSGKLNLQFEEVNTAALLQEMRDRFEEQLKDANCPARFKTETQAIGIWDRTRVEQILANLIANAIKYSPGKPIEVLATKAQGVARFMVRDYGPGIPKDFQARIFERFERASGARGVSGLGLGLFIVKQIVLAHGGSIRLESEPGEGARFIVELPLGGAYA